MKVLVELAAAAVVGLALVHCSAGDPPSPAGSGPAGEPPVPAGTPTFHKDVEPILQKSCQSCHVAGGIAPMTLLTYEDAKPYAAAIATKTRDRVMPPWGAFATPECTPKHRYRGDMSLSDAELATLEAWSAAGAPKGDPKDAPPPRATEAPGLSNASVTLRSTQYSLAATTDQLRCFVLDPKITQTQFLNGSHVVPGDPAIVHHVILYADPRGASRAKADANGQYDCFGGPGLVEQTMLAAWAPGGQPSEYPPNVGVELDPGTLLVMQVHYHPVAGGPRPDATSIELRYTQGLPEYRAIISLIGNDRATRPNGDGLQPGPNDPGGVVFSIPPNVGGHTETMRLTVPQVLRGARIDKLSLFGVAGHMHYIGVAERLTLTPAAGGPDQCLMELPRWDFDWQRRYDYDVPIAELPTVAPGDRINVRCTYDNTTKNPKTMRALQESGLTQPQTVTLGESTLEEMCLGAFVFVFKP
jgi:hypothetical protein